MEVQEPNTEQQEVTLTEELVKELMQLLMNNMVQVRHGTLSAILQYTPTREAKLMFKETELMVYLRKYIFEPQLTKICLSTLIHFATEVEFVSEYGKLVEPLVLQMREWKELELELGLLLLLNLSKEGEIMGLLLGEGDKKGYLMQVLYTLMQKQDKLRWIVVGIFVNVSSQERGRRFFVQQGMGVRFVQYTIANDQKLRQSSLKILRNCAFEWQYQPFAKQIFKPQYPLFTNLMKLIIYLIYKRTLIPDLTHTSLLLRKFIPEDKMLDWQYYFISTDDGKAIGELELAIDLMLILSNIQDKGVPADKELYKEVIGLLKFTDIKEEVKDKLEALEIFAF